MYDKVVKHIGRIFHWLEFRMEKDISEYQKIYQEKSEKEKKQLYHEGTEFILHNVLMQNISCIGFDLLEEDDAVKIAAVMENFKEAGIECMPLWGDGSVTIEQLYTEWTNAVEITNHENEKRNEMSAEDVQTKYKRRDNYGKFLIGDAVVHIRNYAQMEIFKKRVVDLKLEYAKWFAERFNLSSTPEFENGDVCIEFHIGKGFTWGTKKEYVEYGLEVFSLKDFMDATD